MGRGAEAMAARKATVKKAAAVPLPLDVRLMNTVAALIFLVAGCMLFAATVRWATRSPVFTLQGIALDAALQRTNLSSVRANALPRLQGNFFSVDLDATRAAFESVPWVRRATVKRVWPNKLAVALEEHQAAALWQGDDRRNERLVNTHGEVFEANVGDVEDEELPTLAGPDVHSAQVLGMLQRLTSALAPLDEHVQALRLSSRGSWRAELDSGATLELGRGRDEEVADRVERFVRTLDSVSSKFSGTSTAKRALIAADLRHPDGYALRMAGISTAERTGTQKTTR
jgi:cell division protein FtsQ